MRDQKMRCDNGHGHAKYYATEAAVRCAKKAVDIHGGYGYMMEYPVQRLLPGCGDPDRLGRHLGDPENRHGPQSLTSFK